MNPNDFSDGLTRLFVQAAKLRLLTPQQEIEYGRRAQKGDLAARNKLVEHNIRLAVKLAKAHRNKGIPFEDLVQEAVIGLHRAADKFDPERGFRFTTYATWWITHFCQRAVQNKSTAIRVPWQVQLRRAKILRRLDTEPDATIETLAGVAECTVEQAQEAMAAARVVTSLDIPTGSDDDDDGYSSHADPNAEAPDEMAIGDDRVRLALAQLPEDEALVIRLRFGFDGPVRSRREIADNLGMDERVVSRHQRNAIKKLRAIISEADGAGRPPGVSSSSPRRPIADPSPICSRKEPPC